MDTGTPTTGGAATDRAATDRTATDRTATDGVGAVGGTDGNGAGPGVAPQVEAVLAQYRRELTGYCYRMLGSAFEAEDAVQETLVRAWRGFERFEGRSSVRSWLYRIATNVCLTMLDGREKRARPMDLSSPIGGTGPVGEPLAESVWLGPVPDGRVLAEAGDPAEVAAARETIRLAFVAALQYLPPRQRAVLVLREVLEWSAAEVAELLDSSVPSVNSALQRARATLADRAVTDTDPLMPSDEAQRDLIDRYMDAFERYDMDALAALLHEDVVLSMPPLPMWLRGPADIRTWMLGIGHGCRGSRLIPVAANGAPAFGQYRPAADGDGWNPWALLMLEIRDGRITGITNYLDTEKLFPLFDLPPHLSR